MTTFGDGRILVPLANEDDAIRTLVALGDHVAAADSHLRFLHVIEKAGGAPDKAPLPARQDQARRIFGVVREHFDGTGYEFDTELRYGTDVIDEIVAAAAEGNATAIAFVPRPGGRIAAIVSGNLTDRIVSNDRFPVIVLPDPTADGTK